APKEYNDGIKEVMEVVDKEIILLAMKGEEGAGTGGGGTRREFVVRIDCGCGERISRERPLVESC
ncbi:hypothetical protein WICPIJ_003967, partial [Wickerhamomyces pijperi]